LTGFNILGKFLALFITLILGLELGDPIQDKIDGKFADKPNSTFLGLAASDNVGGDGLFDLIWYGGLVFFVLAEAYLLFVGNGKGGFGK